MSEIPDSKITKGNILPDKKVKLPGCSLLPMEKQLLNPLLHRCSAQKSGKALANPLFIPD